jgi:hypothetical protein
LFTLSKFPPYPSSALYKFHCTIITENLIYAGKEVGLEINVDKTKYMLLSGHQNVGQNQDIKIANRSFEICHS